MIGHALALALALAGGVDDELSRLRGHRVEVAADRQSYRIADVASEGPPIIGVVRRDGGKLYLERETGQRHRLTGPLARPRIAGPDYKVWVLGDLGADGTLEARRLGVLAPPRR